MFDYKDYVLKTDEDREWAKCIDEIIASKKYEDIKVKLGICRTWNSNVKGVFVRLANDMVPAFVWMDYSEKQSKMFRKENAKDIDKIFGGMLKEPVKDYQIVRKLRNEYKYFYCERHGNDSVGENGGPNYGPWGYWWDKYVKAEKECRDKIVAIVKEKCLEMEFACGVSTPARRDVWEIKMRRECRQRHIDYMRGWQDPEDDASSSLDPNANPEDSPVKNLDEAVSHDPYAYDSRDKAADEDGYAHEDKDEDTYGDEDEQKDREMTVLVHPKKFRRGYTGMLVSVENDYFAYIPEGYYSISESPGKFKGWLVIRDDKDAFYEVCDKTFSPTRLGISLENLREECRLKPNGKDDRDDKTVEQGKGM